MLGEYRSRLPFLARLLTEAMKNAEVGAMFYRTFIMQGRLLFTDFLNVRRRLGELREGVDIEASAAYFLSALTLILLIMELFGGKQVEPPDEERLVRSLSEIFLTACKRFRPNWGFAFLARSLAALPKVRIIARRNSREGTTRKD
jgi:hypothetical protein